MTTASTTNTPPSPSPVSTVLALIPPPNTDGSCAFVGVDGPDAAGKTYFADQLAASLCGHSSLHLSSVSSQDSQPSRPVIRISLDDFHNPRSTRYQLGRESWEGYWRYAFNCEQFREYVVTPLCKPLRKDEDRDGSGSGSVSRMYRARGHDLKTDRTLTADEEPWQTAPEGAIVIVDGVFLHREELMDIWDCSVYLDVSPETRARRMVERRDVSKEEAEKGEAGILGRYFQSQQYYREHRRPVEVCTVLVDNEDFKKPFVVRPLRAGS